MFIFRRIAFCIICYITYKITLWSFEYAYYATFYGLTGLEITGIITAIAAPVTLLIGFITKLYSDGRRTTMSSPKERLMGEIRETEEQFKETTLPVAQEMIRDKLSILRKELRELNDNVDDKVDDLLYEFLKWKYSTLFIVGVLALAFLLGYSL